MKHLNPFFIVYDPRSGSTLLSDIISRNMPTIVSPETNLIINILLEYETDHLLSVKDCKIILKLIKNDRKINDWQITDKINEIVNNCNNISVKDLIKNILLTYINSSTNFNKFKTFGLKKESYILFAEKLKLIFPNAKFICIIRDPRGIFLSKKTSLYTGDGKPFQTNPIKSSIDWLTYLKRVEYINNNYPDSVLIVKYENLLKSHTMILKKLSTFLKLNLTQNDAKYFIHERYQALHINVKKDVLTNNDTKWKKQLSYNEILAIELSCEKKLNDYGYNTFVKLSDINNVYYLNHKIQYLYFRILFYFRSKIGKIVYDNSGVKALRKRY